MNIVGSSYFLRHLRNLDFFTLDFGKAKKDPKTQSFRKVDEFIVWYRNLYNRHINRFGKIGDQITFYEDLAMEQNEFAIFKGDDIYEITFQQDELEDMKNYILETLRKIDETEYEEQQQSDHNQRMVRETVGEDIWKSPIEGKNNGKIYSIDQTLSREEYRRQIKEKFMKH